MKKMWVILAVWFTVALGAQDALALGYQRGDEADAIAVMQQALEDLDLYYADITGSYGERTERAVKLFQEKYGLPQTGVADEETLNRLNLITGANIPLSDAGTTAGGSSSSSSTSSSASSSTTLRNGTRSDAVRKLQEDLHKLGFYSGSITGHYGDLTEEAVRRFQRKHDLDSDGVAGKKTLGMIASLLGESVSAGTSSGSSGATTTPPNGTTAGSATTMLQLGVKSEAVRELQNELTTLGYYSGSITGHYGDLTKEAVRRFQRAHGLTSDGIAGPRTLAKLEEIMAGRKTEDTATGTTTTTTPSTGTTNDLVTLITPTVSLKDVSLLNTGVTLRYGSSSGYVTRLQNALNALGYFSRTATGYFGTETEAAVVAYQMMNSLAPDGIAGRATLSSINEDIQSGASALSAPVD